MMHDTGLHAHLRTAVLEHLRHWWGSDALFHRNIRDADGAVDPKILRAIFRSYGVSRGLRSGRETLAASIVHRALEDWPERFLDRAERVREIAEALSDKHGAGATRGILLSGVSKVVWFLMPEGWTLYDSFARRGCASDKNGVGRDSFDKFYTTLHDAGFTDAMKRGRKIIKRSEFHYLWPERIHDKYLMLCGHDPQNDRSVVDMANCHIPEGSRAVS